jgi:nitroreductase
MQEAWANLRETLAKHFALSDAEMIYCGMAIGYADETAPVNTLRSDRIGVDELTTFKGF